jgi:Fe-Mn family superoxide dismutase
MQPAQTGNSPFDASGALIEKQFGNFSDFKDAFAEEALSIQGSGWCYLSTTGTIKTIQNHKSVSDVAVIVDMWEHAYYMDYGPDKKKYLANIWKIVDWQIVNARLGNTQ